MLLTEAILGWQHSGRSLIPHCALLHAGYGPSEIASPGHTAFAVHLPLPYLPPLARLSGVFAAAGCLAGAFAGAFGAARADLAGGLEADLETGFTVFGAVAGFGASLHRHFFA